MIHVFRIQEMLYSDVKEEGTVSVFKSNRFSSYFNNTLV